MPVDLESNIHSMIQRRRPRCKCAAEAREVAAKMFGYLTVTHQTGPHGRLVNKVLFAESAVKLNAKSILRSCSIAQPPRR